MAAFKDGAVYISNIQDNNNDMVDDLIHEISHSLEQPYGYEIYGDQKIQKDQKNIEDLITKSDTNKNKNKKKTNKSLENLILEEIKK